MVEQADPVEQKLDMSVEDIESQINSFEVPALIEKTDKDLKQIIDFEE